MPPPLKGQSVTHVSAGIPCYLSLRKDSHISLVPSVARELGLSSSARETGHPLPVDPRHRPNHTVMSSSGTGGHCGSFSLQAPEQLVEVRLPRADRPDKHGRLGAAAGG